ncbi:MAG: extracellular solute-binding protein [Thermomicrobiales bacterium]|nr:extracellular solute-binding protein [Thermomicrobiales bacterium]
MFERRATRRRVLGGLAAGSLAGAAGLALPRARSTTFAAPAVLQGADLRIWALKTYVEPTNEAIEASVQRWAEKNNATAKVEYFTFEDMQTKYVAAIENGNTPDIGQLETGAPARFAGMGQLLDLTKFAAEIASEVGTAPEHVAPVTKVGDVVYAMPWYVMPAFWYVWRDVLDAAGVDLPKTYDDAMAAAKATTRPDEGIWGLGQSWNRTSDGYGVMQSLMYSYGAPWANEDGTYTSIATENMQAAMQWAVDIYKDDLQPPDALSWTGSSNNEAFVARKIAQTSNGPSVTYALETAVEAAQDAEDRKAREADLANHVALPMPSGIAGQRMWAIAMSYGIFNNTKNPDAAMSLLHHLLSPEETVAVMQESSGQFVPILSEARTASRDYFMERGPNYETFYNSLDLFAPTGWPGAPTAAAAEVQASNVLTDMPARSISEGMSVDDAIEFGDERIKEIYESLG